jgi:hypothetical protein
MRKPLVDNDIWCAKIMADSDFDHERGSFGHEPVLTVNMSVVATVFQNRFMDTHNKPTAKSFHGNH